MSDLNPVAREAASRGLAVKSTNPKDLLAVSRTPLWLIPGPAKIHQALAHLDGARKYGPYNWRAEGVSVSVYVSAVQRHLDDYLDGEDIAPDSLVHHLGHAIAGLNIILDSLAMGNLIDDRPTAAPTGAMHSLAKAFISGESDEYTHRGEEIAALAEVAEHALVGFSDADLITELEGRGYFVTTE